MSERPPQLLAPNGEPFNSQSEEEPRDLVIPGEDYPHDKAKPEDLFVPGGDQLPGDTEPKTLVPHDYSEPGDLKDLLDSSGESFYAESDEEPKELIIPGRREINPDAADDLILPGSSEFIKDVGGTSHHVYEDYNEAAGGEDRQKQEVLRAKIDEADAINRPTKRMRTLQKIAHEALDSGHLDLAIEAASRIRVSKTRKKRSLSQLWVSNVLAHDQVMRDIADRVGQPHLKLEVAENIRFGYKRNPVMGAIIDSTYESASPKLKQVDHKHEAATEEIERGWHLMDAASTEDEARELKKQAKELRKESSKKLEKREDEDSSQTDGETANEDEESKEARRARLKEVARLDEEARELQRKSNALFNSSDEQHERGETQYLMDAARLENEARDLEVRAAQIAYERIRGWGAPKHFGEALVRWAIFEKDPDILTALGGVRHFFRKRKAKKVIKKESEKDKN